MLLFRILPILIIGGGFLICREIFRAFPLSKNTLENETNDTKVVSIWIVSLFIIIGHLYYIYKIFSKVFSFFDSLVIPLLIGVFVAVMFFTFFILKRLG